ncbi:MAG: type II secretion system F family protein [Spirochaetaceae bacterium]
MLTYKCRVVNELGQIAEVFIQASDNTQLKEVVNNRHLTLLSSNKSASNGLKIKKNDLLTFTQTLSLLLSSNLSLKDSISVSISTFKEKKLISLCQTILNELNKGNSFCKILKENTVGIPSLYLGLIGVGEKTGTLKSVLLQLDKYLERNKKFQDKLIGALIYPCIIILMTIIFSIVFVLFILPKFNQMFLTLGGSVADVLENRGAILSNIMILSSSIFIILSIIIFYFEKLGKVDYKKVAMFHRFYFKIPIFGKLLLENETLNLIFALSVLTDSSLNIEESLEYGKNVLNNCQLKTEVDEIKEDIVSGITMSEAFNNRTFPFKISAFVKVGEKTGDISKIFNQLTSYYLKETDKKLDRFMTIIDPLFTLLIGAALFSIILLFILPVLTKMGDLL